MRRRSGSVGGQGGQPPRSTRPSQDGSPPRGGPCGPRPAAEREARLIDEDNGRMLPPGFFSRMANLTGEAQESSNFYGKRSRLLAVFATK